MITITNREAVTSGDSQTAIFTGREHDADVSFFWMDEPVGGGPEFHWHPYAETWVVLAGQVCIETQEEELQATAGDIVTVTAQTVHRFRNTGHSKLRMICIHPSPEIIETFI